jgi:hypothetical protein
VLPTILLAADAGQRGHRGDISLHRGAYLLTHPPSVARLSSTPSPRLVRNIRDFEPLAPAGLVQALGEQVAALRR